MAEALCILAGGKTLMLAATAFSLAWTHSVEKTEWRENWTLTPVGMTLIEARVKGSGAGIDPPEGSVLKDGWWIFRPDLPPQQQLTLAASGATGAGWTLCAAGQCHELGRAAGEPIKVAPCRD